MRLVKAAFCLFCATLLAAGCSKPPRPTADDPRELCRFVVRGAADPAVMTWQDGAAAVLLDACPKNPCFIGAQDGVATLQEDGRMRVRYGVHDVKVSGVQLRPFPRASSGAFLLGRRVAVVPGPAGGLSLLFAEDEAPREVPLPALDDGEVLHAVAAVAGGVLAHTLLDDEALRPRPGRALWLLPPTDPALAAIPAGQWPVVKRGVLRGQVAPAGAGWDFVGMDGARIRLVDEPDEQASIPTVGFHDDGTMYAQNGRVARFFRDGAPIRTYDVRDRELFWLESRLYALDPVRGVVALRPTGEEVVVAHPPGLDLAGAPWPQGSVVDRTKAVSDGRRTLVVIERAITSTCRVDDRVHVVDVEARTVTTVGAGDKLRYGPAIALGRPAWIEADVTYRTVSSD